MAKLVLILGGILALTSLLFGWWFSYWGNNPSGSYGLFNPMALLLENTSVLIYNISPIYQGGSPGIPINQTSLGAQPETTSFAIKSTIMLVLIGGVVGIASGMADKRNLKYGVLGGAIVLLGVVTFIAILVIRAGTGILFGYSSMLNASWGLGLGLFVALVSAIMMIVAHKLNCKCKL